MAKYKSTLFWVMVWIVLFAYLQIFYKYHFFYMEQSYLFLFDKDYILDNLTSVGGFSFLLAGFLNQFFIYPLCGSIITTTLLVIAGILTARILKRIAPQQTLPLLYLMPAVMLMFIHFHFNYFIEGTLSFIISLLALWVYMRFHSLISRMIYLLIAIPFVFWLAGPVSILLAASVLVKEICTEPRKSFWFLIPCAEALLLSVCSIRMGWIGEYRFALLPDKYYYNLLAPDKIVIYLSWISLLIAIAVAGLLKNRKPWTGKSFIAGVTVQLVLIIVIAGYRHHKYIDGDTLKFKEIEYYNRTQQWDKVIDLNRGNIYNYLYACYLNIALANKGELGEKMFEYDQPGAEGLIAQWIQNHHSSKLLSDIYFTIGSIASAQEKGFEANLSSPSANCSYTLQRLIQTNIILGQYEVAEKYIDILSKTLNYKAWAEEHRKFLYNDEAVMANQLLGGKRKSLPESNYLYQIEGIMGMLERSAESNPQDKTAIEYMGAAFLLPKALGNFGEMLDTYYGTDVLPALPKHFQEAAIILYEREPEKWPQYGVSPETIERFNKFQQFVRTNQNRPYLAESVKKFFGNTYWYYFMYK